MTMLAGVDFSSHAIDVAIVPIDPDGPGPAVTFRRLAFHHHADPAQRAIDAGWMTRSLISDVDGHPVQSTYVEEPWTRSWTAARALFPIYGAILTGAGFPKTRRAATGITAVEWRQALNLPQRHAKDAAFERARSYLIAEGPPELAYSGTLTEHLADALCVALAGRALTWRHHEASTA